MEQVHSMNEIKNGVLVYVVMGLDATRMDQILICLSGLELV